jgi:hypothetical protein
VSNNLQYQPEILVMGFEIGSGHRLLFIRHPSCPGAMAASDFKRPHYRKSNVDTPDVSPCPQAFAVVLLLRPLQFVVCAVLSFGQCFDLHPKTASTVRSNYEISDSVQGWFEFHKVLHYLPVSTSIVFGFWSLIPPTAMMFDSRSIVGLVLIVMAATIVYSPALTGGFVWDDHMYVPKPELQTTDGLRRIWFEPGTTPQYYPLLYTTFWLQYRLWADASAGYHVVNLLWHLAAVVLTYAILKKLEVPGALLAAGIFALHPVHVETVAWISEQKNTLSGVFYLAAMFAYIAFDDRRQTASSHCSKLAYVASLVFFTLSVLSKSVTATLPGALLVICWWRRGRLDWRRDVMPLIPFVAIGLGSGSIAVYAEQAWVGAAGVEYELSAIQRGLVAGRSLWFYLGKLLLPVNLAFSYPKWEIDVTDWTQWVYPAGILALTLFLWALRRRSRAPLAALLFFAGTLFPALGFGNVFPFRYSYVADHFQYLASLGIIALAAAGIVTATQAIERSAPYGKKPASL